MDVKESGEINGPGCELGERIWAVVSFDGTSNRCEVTGMTYPEAGMLISTGSLKTKRHLAIVGRQQDQLLAFEIYRYFELLCREFADKALRIAQQGLGYKRARKKRRWSVKYKDSFSTGFCGRLAMRMIALHEASMQVPANPNALIHVGNKLKDSEDWAKHMLNIEMKHARLSASSMNGDGFFQGVESADTVALTHKTVESGTVCTFPRRRHG